MAIDIQDDILHIQASELLEPLLADRATGQAIVWATDSYRSLGPGYHSGESVRPELTRVIQIRARKAEGQCFQRTRQHGEVFTPLRVCRQMNGYADELWFGTKHAFDGEVPGAFPEGRDWRQYVDSRRLEIACGEAPYLVSRYDAETGRAIPVSRRTGLLDRKLRVVGENASTAEEWMAWALRAFQASYGYEIQGDSLLIARINLLMTFEEYLRERWNRPPAPAEHREIVRIITWNLWQMDALTGRVPLPAEDAPPCRIFDWRRGASFPLSSPEYSESPIFDLAIGNPPYQDDRLGQNKGFAPPVYHRYMEHTYRLAAAAELIHPARFLFDAGSTPKAWNRTMLDDPHFKILRYEPDAGKLFQGPEIKGGVVITLRDTSRILGPVGVFTPFPQLNSIMAKAAPKEESDSLAGIIAVQNRFNLDTLYLEHPEYRDIIGSDGRDKRFRNNIFEKIPLFREDPEDPEDIAVLGVVKNRRQRRYLPCRFIDMDHISLLRWKVLVARANGRGTLGEVLSTPMVAGPRLAYTQTFIGVGAFRTREEAENALRYIKTKFARIMLGILKVTQDNNRDKWRMVPLQDFSPGSFIDWTAPISQIDRQLYDRYRLTGQERLFIEEHAECME